MAARFLLYREGWTNFWGGDAGRPAAEDRGSSAEEGALLEDGEDGEDVGDEDGDFGLYFTSKALSSVSSVAPLADSCKCFARKTSAPEMFWGGVVDGDTAKAEEREGETLRGLEAPLWKGLCTKPLI